MYPVIVCRHLDLTPITYRERLQAEKNARSRKFREMVAARENAFREANLDQHVDSTRSRDMDTAAGGATAGSDVSRDTYALTLIHGYHPLRAH